MNPPFSFILLFLCFFAIVVLAIIGNIPDWSWYIPAGIGIMATLTIFRGTYLPRQAVARGMELIKSQDYNNRLVKVGEPNADRIVALFNSLIDKLRAERLINREQESLLKLLIDASPMGVVMLDFDRKISMVNSSFYKICGLRDKSNLNGKKITDIPCDLLPEILKTPLGKSEIIRKGNFRIFRCYHLNFIQEGFKREFYLLESLTDEIMKAEKAAYEKVIRTISHEVNNSMGGVKSVLEIMEDITENPEVKKVIQSCENRCESMCNFIRDYAEVVKITDPIVKEFDLSKEIEMMVPFLRQILPLEVSLIYVKPEGNIIINADSSQIQQVILNIVKNAAESIKGKGFIEISINPEENGVRLFISNNGEPIKESDAKQLFTPFFTTKPDGKGIGLTFVREVLNHHKADYSLQTDTDSITRFSILFPKYRSF